MRKHAVLTLAAVIVGVCAAAAPLAHDMPKLPADITLKQSGDSPGRVRFSHTSHLSFQAKPDCTVCHPKPFRILGSRGRASTPMGHARMHKGELCGACHEGKKAFALADGCTLCHQDDSKG